MTRARLALTLAGGVAALAVLMAVFVWAAKKDRAATADQHDAEALGDYGRVPPFTLTERSGRRVTRDDLRGAVAVVDFIYTACTDTCPAQSLALSRLQDDFAGAPLRLVSISVDPDHDTPAVLRRYAARYRAGDRWWFLTGDRRAIYCLAKDGFRLMVTDPSAASPMCGAAAWLAPAPADARGDGGAMVLHSARAVLLDRQTRVRAYHAMTDAAAMARLRENIKRLLAER